jgi:hypothetical protein
MIHNKEMNYFDLLDDWTILRIARNDDEVSRYLMVGFRASCKRMRGLIGIPHKMSTNKLLRKAAKKGSVDGVKLACKYKANEIYVLLYKAARSGWRELCELTREWEHMNDTRYFLHHNIREN